MLKTAPALAKRLWPRPKSTNLLECSLGRYSSRLLLEWEVPAWFDDREDVARRLPAHPNVWTDGSFVLGRVSGASSAGSGMYGHVSRQAP